MKMSLESKLLKISLGLGGFVFAVAGCRGIEAELPEPEFIPALPKIEKTKGHKILDLEKEQGKNVGARAYLLLDSLIKEAYNRIEIRKSYTEEEGIKILGEIDRILDDFRFLYRPTDYFSEIFVPEKLDTDVIEFVKNQDTESVKYESIGELNCPARVKNFLKQNHDKIRMIRDNLDKQFYFKDCDTGSFVYLSIAESLGLPLTSVTIPGHMFVRWHLDNGDYFDWETTGGFKRKKGKDTEQEPTPPEPEPAPFEPFVSRTSEQDRIRYLPDYNCKGIGYLKELDPFSAFGNFTKAIKQDPADPIPYLNLGLSSAMIASPYLLIGLMLTGAVLYNRRRNRKLD